MPTGVGHLGFPPAVILKPDHRKDVALGEAELLGNGCRVAVQCTRYEVKSACRTSLKGREWGVDAYQSAGWDDHRG